jgi:hypothetical protein
MTVSKAVTLCVMLLASAAWLLLAVWGEGGFAAFFANPARTALVVTMLVLVVVSAFSQGNISRGER